MEWEHGAGGFAAMGSEARLAVLRCLVRAGEGGLMVQDIQARTGIAPSTLAHHLKLLASAGLILQRKEGRSTYNTADYAQLQRLAEFILSECCADDVSAREVANDG
ncbi:ArsR/SmtB family transcription factor [Phaeobacter inhibens]|uniref:ArsR/SmtB family transcription factor n=1 Tax=Phaeobacter inhibens TaxID=221822 RepID=UPI0021A4CFFC|nr:metalloregulator ArsR/SmtB family transcription factor [Phaeobacter inhibens]UWR44451.1 metalloregulator ArsR/SmtB family transcription factor [Phaeobacter inhibens]